MINYKEYLPKILDCFDRGYSFRMLLSDLLAGLTVGVIALPLALAFAIGSGVSPEKGLFTAIIAGFAIALLGGSRTQIAGPTGAFVVVVYSIVQQHGYQGLALATLMAGTMMIFMGLARFGFILKFIPFPVITGFTSGIAVVIFMTQIKDFFGLQIDHVPAEFWEKCVVLYEHLHTWSPISTLLSTFSLALIFLLRHYAPNLPGIILVIIITTLLTHFLNIPVDTIYSKFGIIPSTLPSPSFPTISYSEIVHLFPAAITIALVGAAESLLTAAVSDGLTGHHHRPNCELVAQGTANIGSILFGGIPVSAVIASTITNVKLGAKTPIAGLVHAITLLLIMLYLTPLAEKIPLAALSAVLIYVAWNMSEFHHFAEVFKSHKTDGYVLLTTFLLTVLIDLAVAVQVGIVLSAVIFVKKVKDNTTLEVCRILFNESNYVPDAKDSDLLFRTDIPSQVMVFEIDGPLFYSVAELLNESLLKLDRTPKVYILRTEKVPLIDSTGIKALKDFKQKCDKQGILFLLAGVSPKITETFQTSGLQKSIGENHIFKNIDLALEYAKNVNYQFN